MGKTRPLPLTAWPVQRAAMPRQDATVHLGALDLVPADAFEARLAEIDGARYGSARVRGGRVVAASRPPSPAPARRPPPPPPPAPRAKPAAPSFDVQVPAGPSAHPSFSGPAWAPLSTSPLDDDLVTSFRTGPFARLWAWLARLLR